MAENNKSDRELLIRLDERITIIQKRLETQDEDYVSKTEFAPVQRAVYAAIGFIVVGVFGGFITMLIKGGLGH